MPTSAEEHPVPLNCRVVPLDCYVENKVDLGIENEYSKGRNRCLIKPQEGMERGNSTGCSERDVT